MQLRGLLACEYNPAAPRRKVRTAATGDGSSSSSTGSSSELLGYAEAQAAAFDALDSTAAFGVSEVITRAHCAHCYCLCAAQQPVCIHYQQH
jgi:hypothetical protein